MRAAVEKNVARVQSAAQAFEQFRLVSRFVIARATRRKANRFAADAPRDAALGGDGVQRAVNDIFNCFLHNFYFLNDK